MLNRNVFPYILSAVSENKKGRLSTLFGGKAGPMQNRSRLELEAELELNVAQRPSAVGSAEAGVIRLRPGLVHAAVGVELAVHHRQVRRTGELRTRVPAVNVHRVEG